MKCTFCGYTVPKGTGKLYIEKDGKTAFFLQLKMRKK